MWATIGASTFPVSRNASAWMPHAASAPAIIFLERRNWRYPKWWTAITISAPTIANASGCDRSELNIGPAKRLSALPHGKDRKRGEEQPLRRSVHHSLPKEPPDQPRTPRTWPRGQAADERDDDGYRRDPSDDAPAPVLSDEIGDLGARPAT